MPSWRGSTCIGWPRGSCPLCGGEPDLAVITPAADRLLICGRCLARWRFDQLTCPFCLNPDRSKITSFASRDGRYRLSACDVCERYLKAYDATACGAAGDAGRRFGRHAAARRGRHAARLPLDRFQDQPAAAGPGARRTGKRPSAGADGLCGRDAWARGPGDQSWFSSLPSTSPALSESQLNRWRVSQKRPLFEPAPSTTTATWWLLCGRRSSVARQ